MFFNSNPPVESDKQLVCDPIKEMLTLCIPDLLSLLIAFPIIEPVSVFWAKIEAEYCSTKNKRR
jgi:hypothetical protein